MPSRYHPIEDGLWNDSKLEGASFEEHGFFAFLCSNERQRPSGIYRATDEQLSADTTLPIKRVRSYMVDLQNRALIVRDGAWIFVKTYLKRQPNHERLLIGARRDVESCDSVHILEAFAEQYPIHSKWSADRLETVNRPMNENGAQSSIRAVSEQSINTTEHRDGSETVDEFVATWNEIAESTKGNGLPGWHKCSGADDDPRRKNIIARLKEAELGWHRRAMERFAKCTFSRGGAKPTPEHPKPFRAHIDWWVANALNCVKAAEGRYDD